MATQQQLHKKIRDRIEFLRKKGHPETMYSARALAQVFKVTDHSIMNWRKRKMITGISTGRERGYVFRLGTVLDDLENIVEQRELDKRRQYEIEGDE